jgi:lipopolysaccharide/colanic/teichoic acid biosynthesis glycosyltransferase
MKRIVDIILSSLGLLILSPLLTVVCYLIWRQDHHSPFYIAPRVGKNELVFKMVKLRSMVVNADKTGVDSTSANDSRITPIGHFVRKLKLDEFTQLWNVLVGDMSLVGPRPNVKRETDLYTDIEKGLLRVKPGITDFSSIVFSDENNILKDCENPDISYNQLIRPWKSRLGLLYVENQSLLLDVALLFLTLMALVSRDKALEGVNKRLLRLNAPADVIRVSMREGRLEPFPPPGSDRIVVSRESVCVTG